MLLTRSPLEYPQAGLSVRLACVKHAASVRPEPGSNSPMKTIRKLISNTQQKPTKNIDSKSASKEPDTHQPHPHKERNQQMHENKKISTDFRYTVEFSNNKPTRDVRTSEEAIPRGGNTPRSVPGAITLSRPPDGGRNDPTSISGGDTCGVWHPDRPRAWRLSAPASCSVLRGAGLSYGQIADYAKSAGQRGRHRRFPSSAGTCRATRHSMHIHRSAGNFCGLGHSAASRVSSGPVRRPAIACRAAAPAIGRAADRPATGRARDRRCGRC